ncbi:Cys-tRNA(Pro) deacylase, prolyl-tRNA editing enzyme YbaK/EbsC [Pseudovibrio denitrificans]|uniref:Cys-tRNA(Pro) deacylase, prolyl-tRNA editing enzyme YbaK/EbsC n=2 Tax=Pseudovibrio TaxID=258255 RepID=A0A1I7ALS7_9HYPH|nr:MULTISPECIES: YbaK/EbsC family protein [Pseudovibrio]QUS55732.1 YbaK/EbsC family protein [Pseudovibrio brasiliensis]SFT75856.1 Cys-tRNA(Pro) deacylase, prolyl-tRNA editing enzyme YbaK/EbsC [Pseudovibrio denitrificans]
MLQSKRAKQFQSFLDERGLGLKVVELPDSSRSAAEAAQALGCAQEQIVKSLVFQKLDSEEAILVLASGTNRVNEEAISALVGGPIGRPDAKFVRNVTGFSIGGIPPLGHKQQLTVYVDEDLLGFDEVWAAAGTPNAVFMMPGNLPDIVGEHQVICVK